MFVDAAVLVIIAVGVAAGVSAGINRRAHTRALQAAPNTQLTHALRLIDRVRQADRDGALTLPTDLEHDLQAFINRYCAEK